MGVGHCGECRDGVEGVGRVCARVHVHDSTVMGEPHNTDHFILITSQREVWTRVKIR